MVPGDLSRPATAALWPDLRAMVMPRNAQGAAPDPILDALAENAAPWNLQAVARILRDRGLPIPTRVEAEMAVAAHFLIGHALRSGTGWRVAVHADLTSQGIGPDSAQGDPATKTHNVNAGSIVAMIVKPVIEADGSVTDIMVLTESVLMGVYLACVKLGGDDKVLDVMVNGVRRRLAEQRLGPIEPAGQA